MDANDLLMAGGTTSAAFPTIGTSVTGRIIRKPEARQQTDMKTGEPLTFPNGDPRMQIIVNLATDLRDPEKSDDDGERALYIKSGMLNAVRDAVRKAGATGLEVGGTLTVTYIGDGEQKTRGFDPPKIYSASYVSPAGAANEVLMSASPASSPPWPTVATPGTPTPAAVPPPAPKGVDPAMWARMAPEQQRAVLAAMGQVPPF